MSKSNYLTIPDHISKTRLFKQIPSESKRKSLYVENPATLAASGHLGRSFEGFAFSAAAGGGSPPPLEDGLEAAELICGLVQMFVRDAWTGQEEQGNLQIQTYTWCEINYFFLDFLRVEHNKIPDS
jgi:hypothetical protein